MSDWINWQQFQEANEPQEVANMQEQAAQDAGQLAQLNSQLNSVQSRAVNNGGRVDYGAFQKLDNAAKSRQQEMMHRALTGWNVSQQTNPMDSQWEAFGRRLRSSDEDVHRQAQQRAAQQPLQQREPVRPRLSQGSGSLGDQLNTSGQRYKAYSDMIQNGVSYADALKKSGVGE